MPAHFGNELSVFLPLSFRRTGLTLDAHRYNSYTNKGFGLGLGIHDIRISRKMYSDIKIKVWDQPASFFGAEKIQGGFVGVKTSCLLNNRFSGYFTVSGKTEGFMPGIPYLNDNISIQLGMVFSLLKDKDILLTNMLLTGKYF